MNASSGSPYPLPLTPEEVTAAWLSAATGHVVDSAQVVDIILGTSTKIRVRVKAEGLPESLIVKGGFEEHSPMMKEMYANEVAFYTRIAPALPIHAPKCWFAGSDPESHQSIVIMEDLVAKGVTFLHAQRPEAYAAVKRRLGDLARFHAASWNDQGLAPGGRWDWLVGRFSDWSMVYAERYLKPEVWQHYCESPRGAAISTQLHDCAWMRRVLVQLRTLEREGPMCIIHGDTHLGNLYVEANGTPGFLDSQPSKASPFMEVAYHIVCALDLADRKAWEQDLLRYYLASLAECGVSAPDWDEAWLQYRRYIAYGLFIFLINEIRFQTEAINTAYAARFGAAMLDHNVLNLIGN
ncbi:phosphotransferase family enzyme [Novosphingobium taihuense]|nr:phosphotransferase family enzyme [Novosphingobium taihuense]